MVTTALLPITRKLLRIHVGTIKGHEVWKGASNIYWHQALMLGYSREAADYCRVRLSIYEMIEFNIPGVYGYAIHLQQGRYYPEKYRDRTAGLG